jgi:hypothetical protein
MIVLRRLFGTAESADKGASPMVSIGTNYLAPDLQRALDAEIETGEHALWTGQPNPSRSAKMALPLTVLGLFFGGLPTFMISQAFLGRQGHTLGLVLIAMPFFLIGLAMFLAPLLPKRGRSL